MKREEVVKKVWSKMEELSELYSYEKHNEILKIVNDFNCKNPNETIDFYEFDGGLGLDDDYVCIDKQDKSISVNSIVKKINSHVSVLKRSDPKAFDIECNKKIISCLFNTLILMLDITYDEAIELVGISDLFLFM